MMPIFVPGFGGVAGTEAAGAVWRGAAAGAGARLGMRYDARESQKQNNRSESFHLVPT